MARYLDEYFLQKGPDDVGAILSSIFNNKTEKEAKRLLLEKQTLENEKLKKETNPLSANQFFQTGNPGKITEEGKLRKIFGVPQGPLRESELMAVDTATSAVPDLQSKTGIPNQYGDLPLSTLDKVFEITGRFNKRNPEDADAARSAEWDRRFQIRSDRMAQQSQAAEIKRQADQDRKDEAKRLFVSPKTNADFRNLNDQIKLASDIKIGLEYAINNGLNVSGILTAPMNKIRETFGKLPKEEQDIITDLRLNFADFVRERGGTAFTETEKEVFGPIMPELNKDEKTNLNRIGKMLTRLEEKRTNFTEQFPGVQKQGGDGGGNFSTELNDALDAITKGADKKAVKERISQKFPGQVNLINAAMK